MTIEPAAAALSARNKTSPASTMRRTHVNRNSASRCSGATSLGEGPWRDGHNYSEYDQRLKRGQDFPQGCA